MNEEQTMEQTTNDIPGYEGLYQVFPCGRVYSVRSKKWLKQAYNNWGYPIVTLFKNGVGSTKLVHRLVAQKFIPNPTNLPQVNHIDENIKNPCVYNLEWCDNKYNNTYKNAHSSQRVRVMCLENGKKYNSIADCQRDLGIENVSRVISGEFKSMNGYHFVRI